MKGIFQRKVVVLNFIIRFSDHEVTFLTGKIQRCILENREFTLLT